MNHVPKVSQGAIHLLKMSRVHESISSLGSLIHPGPPLLQFEAISTYPITYDGGKRVTLPLCNLLLVSYRKSLLRLLFFQAEHLRFLQLLLIRLMLQISITCPSHGLAAGPRYRVDLSAAVLGTLEGAEIQP